MPVVHSVKRTSLFFLLHILRGKPFKLHFFVSFSVFVLFVAVVLVVVGDAGEGR